MAQWPSWRNVRMLDDYCQIRTADLEVFGDADLVELAGDTVDDHLLDTINITGCEAVPTHMDSSPCKTQV